RALAGVAGEKAIHLARRSHPDPLERGLPGLSDQGGSACLRQEGRLVERQLLHRRPEVLRLEHVVIETLDRDAPARVVEGCDDACECGRRIEDRAAVTAGM